MSEVKLNDKQFIIRTKQLQSLFHHPLIILIGKTEDVKTVGHNSALFLYLLSYEFPESAIIINDQITFITSNKKAKILQQLSNIRIISKDDEPEIKKFLNDKTYSVCDIENLKGDFCNRIIENIKPVNVTLNISKFFTIKDDIAIDNIKNCYKATNQLFQKGFKIVERCLLEDSNVVHKQLGNKIENYIDELENVNTNNLDLIYTPLVQSKIYDLKNFENDNEYMYKNVLLRIGLRYNGYCSEMGRSILTNPDIEISETYEKMFKLREKIFELFDENAKGKINLFDINKNIERICKEMNIQPENPCVFSTGLLQNEGVDLEESNMLAFCIDLRVYADDILLNLCDSIYIKNSKIHLMGEVDNMNKYIINKKSIPKKDTRTKEKEIEKNILRTEHQKELMDSLIEERLQFYKKGDFKKISDEKEEVFYVPYAKENVIPRHKSLYVDKKAYAVCVPFNNYVIPFHVTVIKNVSKTEDGILRINFNISGNDDMIKSLSYKNNLDMVEDLYLKITELKKEFNMKKEMPESDETKKLVVTGKKYVLHEVFVKTDVKARKGKASNLEMHENGFRYCYEGQMIEILFENIKHMFLNEGNVEDRCLLHFNLHHPVFIPKKSFNIQFYKESGTNTVQDTSKIKDEYYEALQEKEEEHKRTEINREFKLFVEKIEANSHLRVQIPSKAGAFYGVPHKGSVLIHPTSECLVNLIEAPFFVLTLNEVEIICFERLIFGVKTCDLSFIYLNKEKPVTAIQSVESNQVPQIKEFLDNKNFCFIESKVNIQWSAFVKSIMEDPVQFYESGGWCELQPAREKEDGSDTEAESSSVASSSDASINTSDTEKTLSGSAGESFESSESVAESEVYESDEEEDEESYESEKSKRRRKN
ncbi:FACT complex subunit spt16 [Gurleya vavrai]